MPDEPRPPAGPSPAGTTVSDAMSFEPERLSYLSAASAARRIAERMGPLVKGQTVVLAGSELLADLANLASTILLLDALERDYRDLATVSTGADERVERGSPRMTEGAATTTAVAAAPAVVDTALSLLGLFQQPIEYRGAKTTVDARAFEVALAADVMAMGATRVIVPDFFVVTNTTASPTAVSSRWAAVQAARAAAWREVGPLIAEVTRKDAELHQAMSQGRAQDVVDRLSDDVCELRRSLEPVSELLGRADRQLAALERAWQAVDHRSGLAGLTRLIRAEVIRGIEPLYLHARIVASGGLHRIARSVWRSLFAGDGLSAMGGVVVGWALFRGDGGLIDGGLTSAREGAQFARPGR